MSDEGRVYKWDRGSSFKIDAQTAGEYLEALREQNGGVLKPEDVVEAAKDEHSPIHNEFEWDVNLAAQKHWKDRARNLLNHIVVVRLQDDSPDDGVPAFINVKVTTVDRGYVSMVQVVKIADWREQAIEDCFKMLNALKKRYEQLTELDPIWKAIEKAEQARAKPPKKKSKSKKN